MMVVSTFDNKSEDLRAFELSFDNNTLEINHEAFTEDPLEFIYAYAYRKNDFNSTTLVVFNET